MVLICCHKLKIHAQFIPIFTRTYYNLNIIVPARNDVKKIKVIACSTLSEKAMYYIIIMFKCNFVLSSLVINFRYNTF